MAGRTDQDASFLPPPPEWAPHKAIWTAWPAVQDYWPAPLHEARAEVAALVRALAAGGETVRLLAQGADALATARAACEGVAEIVDAPYGDIWLRDTGPIFGRDRDGHAVAHAFRVNGWGGKFVMDGDEKTGAAIARLSGALLARHDLVLEGGSLDMNGDGAALTTRQCLLNPNRNPGIAAARIEEELRTALGISDLLWLDEGLAGDHTDGHIDNIARFVGPGTVVCQHPSGPDDPNEKVLRVIEKSLRDMRLASGARLDVVAIPGPGRVEDEDGEPVPASHMNFLIGNGIVALPAYNDRAARAADALAPLFPGRRIVPLGSHAVLTGGGSFHCITQQEPQ